MSARPARASLCYVLREDPELAEAIPPDRRPQAIAECTARVIEVPESGGPRASSQVAGSALGLLVLDGLLIRRVGIAGRFGAELVGEGDLLRPWRDEQDSPMLPLETAWSVVVPARVAVLDEEFVLRWIATYPELAICLVARATQRARNLAVQMAIVHQPNVETKLRMLLWHLAGRWGRVRPDATALTLKLTHRLLAELVAARRQTVTTALSALGRRGLVRSSGDSWLLFGDPPIELRDLDAADHPSARAEPGGPRLAAGR